MDLLSRWKTAHLTSDEETAEYLRQPPTSGYTVAIQSPRSDSVPPTIPAVIQSLREPRTGLLGVGNRSPTLCYELRRSTPDRLRLQLTLPTKRLARTFRTQLQTQIPGIGFAPGADGLPIAADMVVAGATLRPTKEAYYLVRTEFSAPPMNHLVASLHRLAMQRTRFLVQILAQPIAGQPVRKWAHGKLARKQMDYLQKEKEKLWGRRSPPPPGTGAGAADRGEGDTAAVADQHPYRGDAGQGGPRGQPDSASGERVPRVRV